jgi:predicted enzyme related to lactoylglutathione lyase
MWRVTDNGWLYLVENHERAGNSLVAILVSDLEGAVQELQQRGITAGPIEKQGDAGLKATVLDPEGNSVALIQVP